MALRPGVGPIGETWNGRAAMTGLIIVFVVEVGRCRLQPVFTITESHVVGVSNAMPVCDVLLSYHMLH